MSNKTNTPMLPTSADIVAVVKSCLWPGGYHITDNDLTRVERIGNQLAGWIDAAMPGYELMSAKAKLYDAEQAQFTQRDVRDAYKRRIDDLKHQIEATGALLAEHEQTLIDKTHLADMARATVKDLEAN